MEQPITINIEKLVDKLEITNSACVNLAEIEASIQDVLLKAVNFASYEHVQNHDTNRNCNSSRSRLSEERTHRASYFRSESSVAKAPPIVNLHIQTLIGKVDIVNLPFDPNTDINGLSSKQVTQMQEKIISALLKTLSNLQEISINP